VSAALILLAAGRDWRVAHLGPHHSVGQPGHAQVGSLSAWGFVALAGVIAVAATRGWGRLPVGLALAASGASAAALSLHARGTTFTWYTTDPATAVTTRTTAWPYVAAFGGVLLAATGVLVALRGRRWAALGARYDAPAVRPPTEADLWSALDRGEDPTADPS
jgi:hypothetical protein